MDYRPLALGVITLIIIQASAAQPRSMDLVTFDAPPYQFAKLAKRGTAKIAGETVETVTCAAKKAEWPVDISLAPQKRATHSLRQNAADGYFAVTPSAELDAIAGRSHPVALEKWFFYMLDPTVNPGNARVGVVDGSNEEAWLKANDYEIYLSVTSPAQLPALLERGRIDVALMDNQVMERLNRTHKTKADQLHSLFLRYAPLHLYVGETFRKTHPEFLPAFNHALPACMENTLALSNTEQSKIRLIANQLLAEITGSLDLQNALNRVPQETSFTEMLTIDSKWQALAPETALPIAEDILALPASQALRSWQSTHQKLVTEAILINKMGAVAAMSKLTSDFWQGDEPKFQKVAANKSQRKSADLIPLYISPIRYDSSAARFQVTVSAPVFPANSETPNGAIALGLDIEAAAGL